jgi:hypothetical protein
MLVAIAAAQQEKTLMTASVTRETERHHFRDVTQFIV